MLSIINVEYCYTNMTSIGKLFGKNDNVNKGSACECQIHVTASMRYPKKTSHALSTAISCGHLFFMLTSCRPSGFQLQLQIYFSLQPM